MAVLSSGPEAGGPLAQHCEGTPCPEEVEASAGHAAGLEVSHCSLVVSPAHTSWFCRRLSSVRTCVFCPGVESLEVAACVFGDTRVPWDSEQTASPRG